MSGKSHPKADPQDILVVDKLADMRLLFSQKHSLLLNHVTEREQSISDLAKALGMNPGLVHYYLKELEVHGLVRQVREEIKGGVVKKFYRATAKRIVLERPVFNPAAGPVSYPSQADLGEILRAIEYLGYHLPEESREDALELLAKYDRVLRRLQTELQESGLERVESNQLIADSAFHIVLGVKAIHDPELARLYSEFEKLFLRYE